MEVVIESVERRVWEFWIAVEKLCASFVLRRA